MVFVSIIEERFVKSMNKRELGKRYEDKAINYLKNKGYEIIERNFYFRGGEIDIIALNDGVLVFIEVKYRSSSRYGAASESITLGKIRKLRRGAEFYISSKNLGEIDVRFEAVLFDLEQISCCEI